MKKKVVSVMLAMTMVASLAMGCGNSSNTTTTTDNATTDNATTDNATTGDATTEAENIADAAADTKKDAAKKEEK